jgi:AcrR family transcriptional regulator
MSTSRQEHKTRTKRALQQAALELFAKNGYDPTTTEEIAEQAGVSPRTFFRYFPTKESVLFVGDRGWLQSLTRQLLAEPAWLSDIKALRRALAAFTPRLAAARRSFILYERAIASSPVLRGAAYDNLEDDIRTLADGIAARRGLEAPDEECSLLAAITLTTYRRALRQWQSGPANADLRRVVEEEFELLPQHV